MTEIITLPQNYEFEGEKQEDILPLIMQRKKETETNKIIISSGRKILLWMKHQENTETAGNNTRRQ